METRKPSIPRTLTAWFFKPRATSANLELPNDAGNNGRITETPRRWRYRNPVIFVVLILVALTQAFDATCICVTLPTIADQLGASVSESLSLGTSFLLAMTVAQPVIIEFSHVFGRKVAYVVSLMIFIIGTVVCGCARTSTQLLVGRSVQGIGAGGPQPLAAMILVDLYPLRKRSRLVSYLNAPWAVGTALGPILGGIFTSNEAIGWRWIFWITLPLLCLALVASWVCFEYDQPQGHFMDLLNGVDWTGQLLFISSAVAFLWALIWGGSRYPWKSPNVLVPLGCAIVGFVILGLYERSCSAKPMFPKKVWNNRSTILQFVNTTIHGTLLWTALYFMSLYYLGVRGYSPTRTGILALPATATIAPMAMLVGYVVGRTGVYRWFLLVGWVLTITVFGVLTLINRTTPVWKLMVITAVLGLAMGILVPAMSVGIQANVPKEDIPYALSMIYTLRAAGQCLGVALGQGVFSGRLETTLSEMGLSPTLVRQIMKLVGHALKTGGIVDHRLLDAVSRSLRLIWIVSCALAGFAGFCLCFTHCPRLPEDGPPIEEVELSPTPGSRTYFGDGIPDARPRLPWNPIPEAGCMETPDHRDGGGRS